MTAQELLTPARPELRRPVVSLSLVGGVAVAVAARLVLPGDMFVALFLAGALVGGLHAGLVWVANREDEPVTFAVGVKLLRGAAAGALLVVTGACISPAIGVVGAGVVLGLLVGAVVLRRHLATRAVTRVSGRPVDDVPARRLLPLPPLPEHSTAELTDAWVRSRLVLRRTTSPRDRVHLVALRQAYLDELERRDAGGVRRWLESGRALSSDPRSFLTAPGPDQPEPGTR